MLLGFRRAPSQACPSLPAFTCRPDRETPAGQGRAERAGAKRRTLAAAASLAVGVMDSALMSLGSSSSNDEPRERRGGAKTPCPFGAPPRFCPLAGRTG